MKISLDLCLLLFASAYCQDGSCPSPSPSCLTCGALPGCFNVSASNYTLKDIAYSSPLVEVAITYNEYNAKMDGTCITAFPKDNSSALVFRLIMFSDGTEVIESYLLADVAPGSIRYHGLTTDSGCSSLVTQHCILGQPCPGYFVSYRCDLFSGEGDPEKADQDIRYAVAPLGVQVNETCYEALLQTADSFDFGNDEFHRFPNVLAKKCVVRFNGAPCVNADRVPCSDGVSLPA